MFWKELKRLLPLDQLHVIDPYLLHPSKAGVLPYAQDLATLLRPALKTARRVVFIYGRDQVEVRTALEISASQLNPHAEINFRRGQNMHARYVVADRSRVIRMDSSFNALGSTFGLVSLVEDADDLKSVLDEVARLDATG